SLNTHPIISCQTAGYVPGHTVSYHPIYLSKHPLCCIISTSMTLVLFCPSHHFPQYDILGP
ncbi:hypothetical protein BDW75DRAFT_222064, partial [Aspergillus navahoensis]